MERIRNGAEVIAIDGRDRLPTNQHNFNFIDVNVVCGVKRRKERRRQQIRDGLAFISGTNALYKIACLESIRASFFVIYLHSFFNPAGEYNTQTPRKARVFCIFQQMLDD